MRKSYLNSFESWESEGKRNGWIRRAPNRGILW